MVGRCLRSVANQTYKDYEIVVVDGHSKDRTVQIARKYADRIMYDEGKGAGAARNLVVKKLKSDIIVFTDGDTVVPKDWLEKIDRNFREKGLVALGGVILPLEKGVMDELMFRIFSDIAYKITQNFGFYQLSGSNSAFLRKVYLKAGGYNEKLAMLDDLDAGLRMSRHGKTRVDPDLIVHSSARRQRQKGYLRTLTKYTRAYLQLIFTRQVGGGTSYLREISK
jgi:glycosyltransferase involved in cell wall biosynthesis